jgi:hypothetical protein
MTAVITTIFKEKMKKSTRGFMMAELTVNLTTRYQVIKETFSNLKTDWHLHRLNLKFK